ncbi:MAG TPA: dephospho-CoA kinase [Oligoflexia bacterium]|nr:dephospho-CoA kinase [Oligoflexia bacterium]HMP27506.1 dephospho-CoA kinase [Oligoflexia bacterium]
MNSPLIIAITGNIGSGKSLAASYFAELGGSIIEADLLARETLERNSEEYAATLQRFGKQILTPDDNINRKKLAEIIFSDQQERKWLEQLLHPKIRSLAIAQIANLKKNNKLIFYVIPLLFESLEQPFSKEALAKKFPEINRIILISADQELIKKRVANRDGDSPTLIELKLKAQIPDSQKEPFVDYIIRNNGNLKHLKDQVSQIYQILKAENEKHSC